MCNYVVEYNRTTRRVVSITAETDGAERFPSIWENADIRQRRKGPVIAIAFWDPDTLYILVEAEDTEIAEKLAVDAVV
jgi:hypothetical protein